MLILHLLGRIKQSLHTLLLRLSLEVLELARKPAFLVHIHVLSQDRFVAVGILPHRLIHPLGWLGGKLVSRLVGWRSEQNRKLALAQSGVQRGLACGCFQLYVFRRVVLQRFWSHNALMVNKLLIVRG